MLKPPSTHPLHSTLRSCNNPEELYGSWTWWISSIIPALGRLKQEDHCKFKLSLGYTVRLCIKRKKNLCKRLYEERTHPTLYIPDIGGDITSQWTHLGRETEVGDGPDDIGRFLNPEASWQMPGGKGQAKKDLPNFSFLWQLMRGVLTHQSGLPI